MKRLLLLALCLLPSSCARVGRVNLQGEADVWSCVLAGDEMTCTALLLTHRLSFADQSENAKVGWVCVRAGDASLKCIDLELFLLMAQQHRLKPQGNGQIEL